MNIISWYWKKWKETCCRVWLVPKYYVCVYLWLCQQEWNSKRWPCLYHVYVKYPVEEMNKCGIFRGFRTRSRVISESIIVPTLPPPRLFRACCTFFFRCCWMSDVYCCSKLIRLYIHIYNYILITGFVGTVHYPIVLIVCKLCIFCSRIILSYGPSSEKVFLLDTRGYILRM